MPLRAVVGLLFACIARESRAFVTLPAVASTIITGGSNSSSQQHRTTHVQPIMGKKGSRKQKARQPGARGIVEEEKGGESAGSEVSEEEEEDGSVPTLVVMDLDYTLW